MSLLLYTFFKVEVEITFILKVKWHVIACRNSRATIVILLMHVLILKRKGMCTFSLKH